MMQINNIGAINVDYMKIFGRKIVLYYAVNHTKGAVFTSLKFTQYLSCDP